MTEVIQYSDLFNDVPTSGNQNQNHSSKPSVSSSQPQSNVQSNSSVPRLARRTTESQIPSPSGPFINTQTDTGNFGNPNPSLGSTNTQQSTTRSVDIFDAIIGVMSNKYGPKTSEPFIKKTHAAMQDLNPNQYVLLMICSKKYSLQKFNFKTKMDENMIAAYNAQKDFRKEDDIKNSAPRVEYVKNGRDLEVLLDRLFWSKGIDDKFLTWANIVRHPMIIKVLSKVRVDNTNYKTRWMKFYYCNAYWMNQTFNSAWLDMHARLKQVAVAIRIVEGFTLDNKGAIIAVDNELLAPHENYYTEFTKDGKNPVENFKITYTDKDREYFGICGSIYMLNCAVLCDVRKLTQTWEYRMTRVKARSDGSAKDSFDKMHKSVIRIMQMVIVLAAKLKGNYTVTFSTSVTLETGSPFMKAYFNSYQFVHTFIRSAKRELFGGTPGANTRGQEFKNETVIGRVGVNEQIEGMEVFYDNRDMDEQEVEDTNAKDVYPIENKPIESGKQEVLPQVISQNVPQLPQSVIKTTPELLVSPTTP